MKNWKIIILIIFVCTFLSGCVNGSLHYTINNDSSGDVEIKLTTKSLLLSLTNPFEEIKKNAIDNGFEVIDIKSDEGKGFEAKKHYKNYKDTLNEKMLQNKLQSDNVKVKKGIFFDEYKIESNIDIKEIVNEYGKVNDIMLKGATLDFILTMPIKAKENNAIEVSEDGKTYTWHLDTSNSNKIILVANKPNIQNIIIIIVCGVILLFVIIFMLYKKTKKRYY